ncbi:MAG TPA: ADP-ribosylation factor-like protein, partial [Niastella sp.]
MSELAIRLIHEAYEKKSTFLDLGNCGLSEIPKEIVKLKDYLQELNLGRWYIVNGHYIQSANTIDNNLIAANKHSLLLLHELPYLQSLYLHNNGIGEAEAEYLSRLSSLTSLSLIRNKIGDKGAEYISRLSSLRSLNLESNEIGDKGAKYVSQLSSLTLFDLSYNKIGDQGAEYISRLSSLTTLNLANNEIGDKGAKCISRLPLLTDLNLANNKITIFTVYAPTTLKDLRLYGNQIEDLPFELIKHVALEVDFTENGKFENGKILLYGNPITNIPREVLNKGRNAILEYLEAFRRPLNECKLIFVGDGSVGKTSLMKSLVYGEFNKSELTTHGINKIAWKGINNDKGEPIKINCWDFGGQHIQHSLHQFFFTERVVYVLVLNPRNDEKAGYWLDQIDKLGRNSQLIIVYNWKDKEDKQADFLKNFRELRKTYKYLPEPMVLSCATGEGMPDFAAAVKMAVLANDGLKIKYPEKWFNMKEKLETRIPVEEHYIEYAQYETWCKEEEYNEPEQRLNLLRILDSVGSIVFFDKPVL